MISSIGSSSAIHQLPRKSLHSHLLLYKEAIYISFLSSICEKPATVMEPAWIDYSSRGLGLSICPVQFLDEAPVSIVEIITLISLGLRKPLNPRSFITLFCNSQIPHRELHTSPIHSTGKNPDIKGEVGVVVIVRSIVSMPHTFS